MKHTKTLALSALVLPTLAASAGTAIEFAPDEGSSVTKTFVHQMELSLDNMDMLINGQENPMVPEMDMTVSNEQTITVTDEYVSVRGGAPGKLRRTFDSLGWESDTTVNIEAMGQSMDQSQSATGTSELQGQAVTFTWSEDEEDYVVAFDEDEEGDEELLEGLTEDMDLRNLLPSGEIEPGDSWEIDTQELVPILIPGGDMRILPEETAGDDSMMGMSGPGLGGSMNDMVGELLEGTCKATFEEVREVDGVRCAVIQLALEIEGAKDLTETIQEMLEDAELPPEVGEMDFDHLDVELEFEAEGTLLWDLAGGHFHSFELSGDVRVVLDQGVSVSAQGQEMEIENSLELSGTMSVNASLE